MPLQPIRFKTAQELNDFLDYLETLNLITLEDGAVKTTPELDKQFIKASDGSIYLLNDLLQFLNEASEEEIAASEPSFFIGNAALIFNTANLKPVTLAQLKADPNLIEQLTPVNLAPIFSSLNPKLYSDDALPSLVGAKNIEEVKKSYNNERLSQLVIKASSSFSSLFPSLETLSAASVGSLLPLVSLKKPMLVPFAFKGSDLFPDTLRDIYKITLMQQIKLKYRLLEELEVVPGLEEQQQLKQWIEAIDKENAAIKKLSSTVLEQLEVHTETVKEVQERYAKMLEEDPSGEKLKAEIEAKIKEAKELFDSAKNLEPIFDVLKPILVYSTMVALYVLFLAALIVTLMLTAIWTAPIPLLGLTLLAIESIAAPLLAIPLVMGIFELGQLIRNKFDDVLKEKYTKNQELSLEVVSLQVDELFRSTVVSLYSQEFIDNGPDHDAFVDMLWEDSVDVNTFEAELAEKMPRIATMKPKVSVVNPFNLFPSARTSDRAKGEAELTARGSFEI
ncbi:hypothetical protein [Legionella fallonii]|uniref:Uncharacterized protein n=1 Tax=Legionella fallonii LLAP-10 TaxID=1212491 RepID=A0A098G2D2_9GAMM|nr:hypothetical protein [Legionella fallonii]CEG56134.1 protein of unknown function [coiled-coil domain] [Legionella fallonii LLAP-10]